VRVAVANASREAKQKAHFVIDEHVLSMKHQSTSTSNRLWDSLNLRPGAFGVNIDLKKLFRRSRNSSRE